MRNKTGQENDDDKREIEALQREIHALGIRTKRIESILEDQQTNSQRDTLAALVEREPQVGDTVAFKPTKITAGGTGRIIKTVRNFVIIECRDNRKVQRAPRNVQIIRNPTQPSSK